MKISEELSTLYGDIRTDGWEPGSLRILADALQQAVAENLETEFRVGSGITRAMFRHDQNKLDELNRKHNYSKNDWLAEADKLLRGEK